MRKIFLCEDRNVITGEIIEGGIGTDALFVTLKNAAVVRIYGTTRGLGQIAAEGPTAKTILDRVLDGHRVSLAYVIYEYHCNEKEWDKWTARNWK